MLVTILGMLLLSEPCRSPGLGAELTNVSQAARKARGIPDFVTGAFVRIAADPMEPGDVIQAVGPEIVQNTCDARSALAKFPCKSKVRLVVRRGAETLKLDAMVREQNARSDNPQARCRAGDGSGCTQLARQNDNATDLLRQACDLGDGEGCFLLGVKLGNTKEGARAYEQACDHGDPLACTNLGFMFERGEGGPRDLEGAARMYRKGCSGSLCTPSNTLGCINLGRMHRDAMGMKADPREALRLFRLACDRTPRYDEEAEHVARACSLAGTILALGEAPLRDEAAGLKLLDKGCSANDTFGCYNLGVLWQDRDKAKARAYYQRACDAGDAEACTYAAR
jgi:uncharacterized protein